MLFQNVKISALRGHVSKTKFFYISAINYNIFFLLYLVLKVYDVVSLILCAGGYPQYRVSEEKMNYICNYVRALCYKIGNYLRTEFQ
jgi:hypothetical protein